MRISNTLAIVMLMLCFACQNGSKSTSTTFSTDSLSFERTDSVLSFLVQVDFPSSGNPILRNAITEFIYKELDEKYNGNIYDGNAMLTNYANTTYNNFYTNALDTRRYSPHLQYAFIKTIKKSHESDLLVTYIVSIMGFEGGAHGYSFEKGATFRKSDGKIFNYDMFTDTNSREFKNILTSGLKNYFSENIGTKDINLEDFIFGPIDSDFPKLPEEGPYLTADGITFIYQEYEIAPYAAGKPMFTIPYNVIEPYLNHTGKTFIR